MYYAATESKANQQPTSSGTRGRNFQSRKEAAGIRDLGFPVRSLFRLSVKHPFPSLKYSPGTYFRKGFSQRAKFPVFFPVSREFGRRRVREGLRPPPASLLFLILLGAWGRSSAFPAHNAAICDPAGWSDSLWRRETGGLSGIFSGPVASRGFREHESNRWFALTARCLATL